MGRRKRMFDLILAIPLTILLAPVLLGIALVVRLTSRGPALHWSSRVGRNNKLFFMPKFRTMNLNTPQVATHLLANPGGFLTPVGGLLRRWSLDELPQLWSILCGDLSFVGPRPALYNQDDLVALRTACGVHQLVPGLTGWAQINGRDDISIPVKVSLDREYLQRRCLRFDCLILMQTFRKVGGGEGVHH